MSTDYKARQARLREIAGVDAVALVPGPNLVYFTGLHMHLSERPIVALFTPDGDLSVIVPELEVPQLEARPDLEARAFMWTDVDGYMGAFEQAVADLGLAGGTLGVDGFAMRVSEWLAFQQVNTALRGAGRRTRSGDDPGAEDAGRNRQDAAGHQDQRRGAGKHAGVGTAGHDRARDRHAFER